MVRYNKKILAIGIAFIGLFILGIIGLTYAFFTAGVEGNSEATQSVVETADLRLVFNDTEIITIDQALPGVSQTKTFTVTNIGNKKLNYEINIIDVTNTFINDELVYSLTSTNGGASITNTSLPSANGTLISGSINPGVVQTYTMTILFKETGGNQNTNQGAVFTGKLQINTQSAYSDEVEFSIEETVGQTSIGESKKVSIVGNYYGNVTCISGDTNIAECTPSQNEISILAKSYGTTDITVTEDNKNIEVVYTVTVKEFAGNAPVLVAGMTPVKWTGSPGSYAEVNTTEEDPEWYDYSQKKWANAKTSDGSYWVWVPRYAYKITSGIHTGGTGISGTIDVKFLTGTTNTTPDGTTIETSGYEYGVKDTSMHYFTHPAFTFGSDEVSGIWVAKYEASTTGTCNTTPSDANCNKTTLIPAFKPNVTSWRYIRTGNMYTVSYNLRSKSTYGWQSSTVDTHQMKNTEWGAVAYLSQSIYGANEEMWINNSSTYTTGCAGNSVSEGQYAGCQNAYNTATGVKASTTYNITGIYDISGGAYEYTAAYVNNGDGNLTTYGSQIVSALGKYKDVYTVGSGNTRYENYEANRNKYGDAVYETSGLYENNNSWYTDTSYMPYSSSPWFARGGSYNITTNAGAFDFGHYGGTSYGHFSFRASALIPGS